MPANIITQRTEPLRKLFQMETLPLSVAFMGAVAGVGYDLEVAAMDAEALLVELQENLGIEISDFNRAKIVAGQGAYFTDVVYKELPAFIEFANLAAETEPPTPNVFNPADVLECGVAVLELAILDQGSEMQFSEEIRTYWGAVLASEGAAFAFPPLQAAHFSQEFGFDDPAIFKAVEDRTATFEKAIRHALWEHAVSVFDLMVKIPALDGSRIITADQMKELVVKTVGDYAKAS